MRATVVVDNKSRGELQGEWGLCIDIEYDGKHILLDAGASDLFQTNMGILGIDCRTVDFLVLSHAHYDHGNGIRFFLQINSGAACYIQQSVAENCYKRKFILKKYIGISRGMLQEDSGRFIRVSGCSNICKGVYLLSHSTPGLQNAGKREHMFLKTEHGWRPDDFSHEQSLIFETEHGLVVMNSCSHGGAANIIKEVQKAFPEKKVHALIGGFHLFNKNEAFIRDLAVRIRNTGVEYVCTGHCTGERAYGILKQELGDTLHQMHAGLVMNF